MNLYISKLTSFINYFYLFCSYKMLLEQSNIEAQIIELANSIYQNLGIKRWIEEVSAFREVQTYFQICQIIFPDYSIDFYRIDNDPTLKKSQKMQRVIDLISNLLKSDLSHITGAQITKGNPVDLINFLELLQALTINMIQNEEGSVQSAKEYHRSSDETNSYHTVIGIKKQFEKIKYRSDDIEQNEQIRIDQINTKKQIKRSKPEIELQQQESLSYSTDFPIKPIQTSTFGKGFNKKLVKQQQDKQLVIKTHKKQRKNNNFHSRQSKIYQQENYQFLNLVKKIFQSYQELQKNYELTSKKIYVEQLRQLEIFNNKTQSKIQRQATIRKKKIQSELVQQNDLIASLNGQQYIKKAVKNLKRQQRQMKKQVRSKDHEKELKNIEEIMDFNQLDGLLQQAVYSNTHKSTYKRK